MMALTYRAISKVYARRIKRGDMTLEDLAQKVAEGKVEQEVYDEVVEILSEDSE